MKRKWKNIIMLLLILLLIGGTYFVMRYAEDHSASSNAGIQQDTMQKGDTESPSEKDDEAAQNEAAPGDGETPPEKPDGESDADSGDTGTMSEPPEKPEDTDGSTETAQAAAGESSSGETGDSQTGNAQDPGSGGATPPSGNEMQSGNNLMGLSAAYYCIFGALSLVMSLLILYLILSRFNGRSWKQTFRNRDKITILILSTILLTAVITAADAYITDRYFLQGSDAAASGSASLDAAGFVEIEGSEKLSSEYETSESDTSVLLVKNGGDLTLTDATVEKSGGDSSNTERSEFYGINAGILVTEGSAATIRNTDISTDARGSNAVFSTGTDSKISITDSTITTTGASSARGLDATYGGSIQADQVTITTQGSSCAALATDRGEGTVSVENSSLETNGAGSPLIYSTGAISTNDTTGTANGSQIAVIEGKNSAVISDCTLKARGQGNRGTDGRTDQAGVMIYQSMSGDAGEGTGTLTVTDSDLTILSDSDYYKTAPMFFITNTDAVINLENSTLHYGSNVLISAMGTEEWGNSGSNGGNLTVNATDQTLEGDIEIDEISTLELNLKDSSYRGAINEDNAAKSIALTLDQSSKIVLTADSYITSLDDADSDYSNIDFNGYTLYVNGKAVN